MHVDAAQMDGYRAAVELQQEQARVFVQTSIESYAALNPGASVADLREHGKQALEHAMRVYGDIACAAACAVYDEIAASLGYDVDPAVIFNEVDGAAIDRDARYFAGLVGEGGAEEYARRMAFKAYDHAKFSANRTMAGNASRPRDAEAGMRFARVPTGRETCGFCLLLASRGFDYSTREAAGDIGARYNSYHSHCDCTVIAGDERATVDGYDPDWLTKVYQDARAAVEPSARADYDAAGGKDGTGKSYDEYLRDRIAKEISLRDREWAWTGKRCSVTVEPGAKPKKKESDVANRLIQHGFSVGFLRPVNETGRRTADATLNGVRFEFKQPVGDEAAMTIGKSTIDHQFESALGQSGNLVLDVTVIEDYPGLSFDSLCDDSASLLHGKWRPSFDQVLVIGKADMRRYENA